MGKTLQILEQIVLAIGYGVAQLLHFLGEVGASCWDFALHHTKQFGEAIAVETVIFVFFSVGLGFLVNSWFNQRDAKLAEQRKAADERLAEQRKAAEEARRAQLLAPFRRMLLNRIEATHSDLAAALTMHLDWSGHWRRQKIRKIRTAVAAVESEFTQAVLSHFDLLRPVEWAAVGEYREHIYGLQKELEDIEERLDVLNESMVDNLAAILEETDEAVLRIGDAFEDTEAGARFRWSDDDEDSIKQHLLQPLLRRANTIGQKQGASEAPPASAGASHLPSHSSLLEEASPPRAAA